MHVAAILGVWVAEGRSCAFWGRFSAYPLRRRNWAFRSALVGAGGGISGGRSIGVMSTRAFLAPQPSHRKRRATISQAWFQALLWK